MLCIQTWKKFLPEYSIKVLDYSNLKDYLGESIFSRIICKEMTLPIQADAIRVAILKKYGGIWFDVDTIILGREFISELKDTKLAMFGEEMNKTQHIGFIYACKNHFLLNTWLEQIIKNINIYKKLYIKKRNNNDNKLKKLFSQINKWNYLGNGIIDPILKNITDKKLYLRLDKYKMNIFPEYKYFENTSLNFMSRYRLFYFQRGDPKYIINNNKGIILLHNSFTPILYKKMTAKTFLRQDILLSKLLAQILNNTL